MRIKDVRDVISQCKKTELKYQKADLQNPKYKHKHKYTIQHAQYLADNCRSVIQRCLNVNKQLCEKCAEINRSSHFFKNNSPIEISDQGNMRILLAPDEISDFFHGCDNTVFVKQRTEIWHKIHDMCAVTGSTMHNALGLGTLIEQKKHYDEKFGGKAKEEPDDKLKEILDYGTKNEVGYKAHEINSN